MRNLCYFRRTAGCERDKDRELLVGSSTLWGWGDIVRRLWAVVGWLCWIVQVMLGLGTQRGRHHSDQWALVTWYKLQPW